MEETRPSGEEVMASSAGGGGGGATIRDRWYDPTPLLRPQRLRRQRPAGRTVPFLIGRATTRRLMRSPPIAVRETAARQLEERQTDWGYSRPVVALDLVWSLTFVLASCAVLLATARERPSTPIRVWILGYALHCLVHVGFVCFEYRRRQRRRVAGRDHWVGEEEEEEEDQEDSVESRRGRIMKKLESANAVVSFFWWMLGFYWIVDGGQALLQDAPRLYWLTVVFLAFDIFFATFCILLACIIGIALCCCLPCIIAMLYAVTGQEGASDADLSLLPKFRFQRTNGSGATNMGKEHAATVNVQGDNWSPTDDPSVSQEDSECCICLCQYEDGVELCSLPCHHHFHSGCIVKWLRINATCPLCKYSILKGDDEQV